MIALYMLFERAHPFTVSHASRALQQLQKGNFPLVRKLQRSLPIIKRIRDDQATRFTPTGEDRVKELSKSTKKFVSK